MDGAGSPAADGPVALPLVGRCAQASPWAKCCFLSESPTRVVGGRWWQRCRPSDLFTFGQGCRSSTPTAPSTTTLNKDNMDHPHSLQQWEVVMTNGTPAPGWYADQRSTRGGFGGGTVPDGPGTPSRCRAPLPPPCPGAPPAAPTPSGERPTAQQPGTPPPWGSPQRRLLRSSPRRGTSRRPAAKYPVRAVCRRRDPTRRNGAAGRRRPSPSATAGAGAATPQWGRPHPRIRRMGAGQTQRRTRGRVRRRVSPPVAGRPGPARPGVGRPCARRPLCRPQSNRTIRWVRPTAARVRCEIQSRGCRWDPGNPGAVLGQAAGGDHRRGPVGLVVLGLYFFLFRGGQAPGSGDSARRPRRSPARSTPPAPIWRTH